MRKTVIIYGLMMAALIFLLKMLEYRLLIRELQVTHYVGIVAIMFTLLGVWVGRKLTKVQTIKSSVAPTASVEDQLKRMGISKREYEVLALMAKGLTNQQIAESLFISLNTVKTHTSNLFIKLDARRRTQAIEHAKREGILN